MRTFGETHGLGDMFLSIIQHTPSKKTYILNVSMGPASDKVALEILKSLK